MLKKLTYYFISALVALIYISSCSTTRYNSSTQWDCSGKSSHPFYWDHSEDDDLQEKISKCEEQSELGDAKATFNLAVFYARKTDGRNAIKYYKKVIEIGSDKVVSARSSMALYNFYSGKNGFPKNEEKARKYLELSADLRERQQQAIKARLPHLYDVSAAGI